MFVLGGLALYWVECQYPMILILRLNANISVWLLRYSEPDLILRLNENYRLDGQSEELQCSSHLLHTSAISDQKEDMERGGRPDVELRGGKVVSRGNEPAPPPDDSALLNRPFLAERREI
jgi:hypothetical protein